MKATWESQEKISLMLEKCYANPLLIELKHMFLSRGNAADGIALANH
jgi:hypothetical protein